VSVGVGVGSVYCLGVAVTYPAHSQDEKLPEGYIQIELRIQRLATLAELNTVQGPQLVVVHLIPPSLGSDGPVWCNGTD